MGHHAARLAHQSLTAHLAQAVEGKIPPNRATGEAIYSAARHETDPLHLAQADLDLGVGELRDGG